MAINTTERYIYFLINPNMSEKITLLRLANNKRIVFKQKVIK
ncbi:MAG: hypothetical protein JW390_50140 [Nitrosopumilus sp.]|nr:hypothetical protein [Candidatus Nitrosopumilus limneticus]